jgi:hypothetical protein
LQKLKNKAMVSKMAWYGTGNDSGLSRMGIFLFTSLLNTCYVGIIFACILLFQTGKHYNHQTHQIDFDGTSDMGAATQWIRRPSLGNDSVNHA